MFKIGDFPKFARFQFQRCVITQIDEHTGQPSCKHHEIYVGDPNKSAPEKLKTVIRQPFKST